MKVKDYVDDSIIKFPVLYLVDTYEIAELIVLHQAFIVLGNGMEWAYTKDPSKGGYLVHPIMEENDEGDWVRLYDPDYGTQKVTLDKRYFKESLFAIKEINEDLSSYKNRVVSKYMSYNEEDDSYLFSSDIKAQKILEANHFWQEGDDYIPDIHTHFLRETTGNPVLGEKYTLENYDPYPYFSKRYSCFWEINPELIQKDWLLAGIDHLKHWVHYFADPKRYSKWSNWVTAKSLEDYINTHTKKDKGPKWIDYCRSKDGYGYSEFDGTNYENMSEFLNTRRHTRINLFLTDTLNRLETANL